MSGEHSAVYGRPALAMAIDLNAQSTVTPSNDKRVSIDLPDLQVKNSYTLMALRSFKDRMLKNYRMFLNGELGIKDVIRKPVDLMEFGFIIMLDGLHLQLNRGLNLSMRSTIPIGCGLGSSAATILSSLRAVGHYFRVDFKPEWYYEYSLLTEKMQHGNPSGVDSYISLHGGCALFQGDSASAVGLPRFPIHIVNTGAPTTTTGQSVEQVAKAFANSVIWSEFESVTLDMHCAIGNNDREAIGKLVGENQRLLGDIGVVPEKVKAFISELRDLDIPAKVSGAGATTGDNAGIVVVFGEQPPLEICRKYGYTCKTIRGDPLGTRIV